jgi:hypothetical protein
LKLQHVNVLQIHRSCAQESFLSVGARQNVKSPFVGFAVTSVNSTFAFWSLGKDERWKLLALTILRGENAAYLIGSIPKAFENRADLAGNAKISAEGTVLIHSPGCDSFSW